MTRAVALGRLDEVMEGNLCLTKLDASREK